jgi:hypothetical protein
MEKLRIIIIILIGFDNTLKLYKYYLSIEMVILKIENKYYF